MITSTFNGIRVASFCLIGYWIALFAGTHLPRLRLPDVAGGHSDKILHLVAFAGLSFLLSWAIPTRFSNRFRNVRTAGLFAILYGVFDEVTQIPVGRTADWLDLIADAIGVVVGLTSYCVCRELYWRMKPSGKTSVTGP